VKTVHQKTVEMPNTTVKMDPKKEIEKPIVTTNIDSNIVEKKTTDPIKDSVEYKKEREKLLKRWEIAKAENAKLDEKNAKLDEKNAKLDEKNTKLDKERAELDKERARIAIKKTQIAKIN
jgi:predicted nuclease with TOPRIM domain